MAGEFYDDFDMPDFPMGGTEEDDEDSFIMAEPPEEEEFYPEPDPSELSCCYEEWEAEA